jgi:hypothetical protein
VLSRPEFVITELNYKHYVTEGVYPHNQFVDTNGTVWTPVRDRQVRKKLMVAKDFRHIDHLNDQE